MDVAALQEEAMFLAGHGYEPTQMMLNQRKVKARRKRRKELVLIQICLFCGLLLIVKGFSFIAGNSDFIALEEDEERWGGRRLLQEANNSSLDSLEEEEPKNCTAPALHEFPTDLFTKAERAEGAVALHVLCTIYMFCALALVCDDYFVPSLEKICERLDLSEDVAGATFMAAGSSAPELFTSVIGVFITKGDVGVGTIVGSAVFNILCIIGVCGFFAGQAVKLSHWALLRDSIYYTFSIVALIAFIYDENVCWWESLVLILMYAVYILIMKFNGRAQRYFDRRKKGSMNLANGLTGSTDLDDAVSCDATAVLLKKANFQCTPSVLMVDELLSAYPHQLSFSEAGMRIMITSHFSPRTRLAMASRMLINERQRLINTTETRVNRFTNGDSEPAPRSQGRWGLENGISAIEQGLNGRCRLQRLESGNETENETDDNDNNENEGDAEEDSNGPLVPFSVPAGCCNKLKWLFMWPLSLLLFFTVPNCCKRRWERWFMVSFFTATIWIAGLSYIMVWMVTVIGFTLGIPDVIMGITFLAAGTSVPDCMASVIVARQGLGDMAISNSIGSNVFDILVGLGLPWALQTLCIDYGSNVHLNSKGLIFSVGLLLASVFFTVVGVHLNKWTLDKRLGLVCLLMYAVFLCFSILIEFNVFIFVNLPMCRDIH
ncbi:sodium/potassium/calcium exchanger 3-like [Periophthalmus magnuspinnatus]|uniref:sodium/potassium/calcium exchanger 3-like n=1 Tax=Periophthalmus magnuspinnatus TaxID=409849 RepID=UPI0024371C13|nr:sodium/potassium/calcium exchanger 3-like [Periophthalmus magnuspinnatus]